MISLLPASSGSPSRSRFGKGSDSRTLRSLARRFVASPVRSEISLRSPARYRGCVLDPYEGKRQPAASGGRDGGCGEGAPLSVPRLASTASGGEDGWREGGAGTALAGTGDGTGSTGRNAERGRYTSQTNPRMPPPQTCIQHPVRGPSRAYGASRQCLSSESGAHQRA